MDLQGRTAVVTGAASGIGRAIATSCLAAGAQVVAADIEEPVLLATTAELDPDGARTLAVVCDVSDAASVTALHERAVERFGAVHLLCNNAGVGAGGPLQDVSLADWAWVLGVNLWGVIHGIHTFLPGMLAQGEGHIVNTASVAGHLSYPMMGPYNASKHAVVTISETLFHEMTITGAPVGVSVLCPGFVATNILASDRNRPETAPRSLVPDEPSPDQEAQRAFVEALYESALDPAVVGEQVVSAVTGNRFWIFTDEVFDEALAVRHRDIEEQRNPTWRGHLVEEQLRHR